MRPNVQRLISDSFNSFFTLMRFIGEDGNTTCIANLAALKFPLA